VPGLKSSRGAKDRPAWISAVRRRARSSSLASAYADVTPNRPSTSAIAPVWRALCFADFASLYSKCRVSVNLDPPERESLLEPGDVAHQLAERNLVDLS